MRTLTKDMQQALTPAEALDVLKKGNERFVQNLRANRNLLAQVNQTSDGQYPFAVILSCMDSRTSVELIFDQGLGDVFSIRIAGNVINEDILGSIEFAVKLAGCKIVVVLGHTKCGAVTGACNHVEMGNLTGLLKKISPAIQAEHTIVNNRNGTNESFVERVIDLNVANSIREIRRNSPIIRDMEQQKIIEIVGGVYDIDSGTVKFFASDALG
ncbi:MAG TPA: carbonic anhydrase family protein [Turneriella sp.]|nr:carbonic anhydrase family protein [Turneriella sp.]